MDLRYHRPSRKTAAMLGLATSLALGAGTFAAATTPTLTDGTDNKTGTTGAPGGNASSHATASNTDAAINNSPRRGAAPYLAGSEGKAIALRYERE